MKSKLTEAINVLNVHNLGLSRCKSKMKQIKLKHQILKARAKGYIYERGEGQKKGEGGSKDGRK